MIWIRIRIGLAFWIRIQIRIEPMRIHNFDQTEKNLMKSVGTKFLGRFSTNFVSQYLVVH